MSLEVPALRSVLDKYLYSCHLLRRLLWRLLSLRAPPAKLRRTALPLSSTPLLFFTFLFVAVSRPREQTLEAVRFSLEALHSAHLSQHLPRPLSRFLLIRCLIKSLRERGQSRARFCSAFFALVRCTLSRRPGSIFVRVRLCSFCVGFIRSIEKGIFPSLYSRTRHKTAWASVCHEGRSVCFPHLASTLPATL